MQHMVLSLSMRFRGGLSVHSLSENSMWITQRDSTICCMYPTVSSWRWAL